MRRSVKYDPQVMVETSGDLLAGSRNHSKSTGAIQESEKRSSDGAKNMCGALDGALEKSGGQEKKAAHCKTDLQFHGNER